jgi:hypothetical protein
MSCVLVSPAAMKSSSLFAKELYAGMRIHLNTESCGKIAN